MNGDVEKAVENCRNEILGRIRMQDIDDFEKAYVASTEVISTYVRLFLRFSVDEIERLVRKKMKSQEVK